MADIDKEELDKIIQGCIRKVEKSQEMLYKKFFGYALSIAMIYNNRRDALHTGKFIKSLFNKSKKRLRELFPVYFKTDYEKFGN